jgi:uncharacterized coiled-coil protein SlyX
MLLNPNYVIDVTMTKIQDFTKNTVVQEATIKQLNDDLVKTKEELAAVQVEMDAVKAELAKANEVLLAAGLLEEVTSADN